jgi:hypothetical protein
MQLVQHGMFCKVTSGTYKEYGIEKGSDVYVAGSQLSSLDEDDPYVCRMLFICLPISEKGVGGDMFYLNGLNLLPLPKEEQEMYANILNAQEAKLAGEVH